MGNTNNQINTLPEEFASEDEAAEFWDTHSITDYEEFLEPVELVLRPISSAYIIGNLKFANTTSQ
jgi:hypothetical protein